MSIGPEKLDAISAHQFGVHQLGGDARGRRFEDVFRRYGFAHVFVATTAFGAGADVADAGQGIFAARAIIPFDDEQVAWAVDGYVPRSGIEFGFGVMMRHGNYGL